MARTARRLLTIVAQLSVASAGVGAQEENELDRFMARVLEQQGRNVARGLQYVLDERAEVRLAGPGRELLVQGDYTCTRASDHRVAHAGWLDSGWNVSASGACAGRRPARKRARNPLPPMML